ncbi:MAG: hypothetical protein LAP40_12160 [Acidobacteriia bacterium]|nr:hypothetical protein [Terriglobia bacterium]
MKMREDSLGKTVLILDNDLGFVFWLGEILTQAGYYAIPAHTIEEATKLTRRLKVAADVVIVNPAVSGATEWTQSRRNPQFQRAVIAAVEDLADFRASLVGARATGRKPAAPGAFVAGAPSLGPSEEGDDILERCRAEWLATVQQVLEEGERGNARVFPWASLN